LCDPSGILRVDSKSLNEAESQEEPTELESSVVETTDEANRPVNGNFFTPFLPVDTAPLSNRQFLTNLARLETHSNPNKTNADHDF
jgi:hypothetical protein